MTIPQRELQALRDEAKAQDEALGILRGRLRDAEIRIPSPHRPPWQQPMPTKSLDELRGDASDRQKREFKDNEKARQLQDAVTELQAERAETQRVRDKLEAIEAAQHKRKLRVLVLEATNFVGQWGEENIYLCLTIDQVAQTTSSRPTRSAVAWGELLAFDVDHPADLLLQVLNGGSRDILAVATLSLDGALQQQLRSGVVHRTVTALSPDKRRAVQIALTIEELGAQGAQGAQGVQGAQAPASNASSNVPPAVVAELQARAEKAEADLRALQQQRDGALTADATEVNDRVLQALHALSASEGGILQLMQEGKMDAGALAALQNLHAALWRLQGLPFELPGPDSGPGRLPASPTKELLGTQLEEVRHIVRERELELQQARHDQQQLAAPLEQAVKQLQAVVGEQANSMQDGLRTIGELQNEILRLRALVQQKDLQLQRQASVDAPATPTASSAAATVAANASAAASAIHVTRLQAELEATRVRVQEQEREAASLRNAAQEREQLFTRLLSAEERASRLQAELAAAKDDPQRPSSQVTENDGSAALRRRLLEATQELGRARQVMAAMEEELRRAAAELQELRAQAGRRRGRSPGKAPGHFPYFGLELADGVRFADSLGGTIKYGSVKVVQAWGPAAAAGIAPLDFLKAIQGHPIASLNEMRDIAAEIAPGALVTMTIERGNKDINLAVKTVRSNVIPGSHVRRNVVLARFVPEGTLEPRSPARSAESSPANTPRRRREESRADQWPDILNPSTHPYT